MLRHAFDAMGTEVEVLLIADDPSPLDDAEQEFRRLEALLSRFRPDSELTTLNEAGELDVGPELLEVAELAVAARERTRGRFDPTVHDAVVAAGYDRSFEVLPTEGPVSRDRTLPRTGGRVDIDRAKGRIGLEPGCKLDLGGIAKGWTADRVAGRLSETGPVLVNAGGDIAASGPFEWRVAVEAGAGSLTLGLRAGGLATTGRDRRCWTRGGRRQHHIVDPETGRPATTELLAVTVAAPSAAEAEVLATSLFLAGSRRQALEEADAADVAAVLVTSGGQTHLSEALR